MSRSQGHGPLLQSRFAPLDPGGPLPPDLTGKIIAAAYRSQGADLKPRKILRLLEHRVPATPSHDLLHELLYESFGEPRARAGLTKKSKKTRLPPLCEALYQWLKKQEWTQPIYDALIAPAEVTRNEKTFLDPEQFREIVKDRAPGLLNREAGETSEESSESALALFSLAFALLQPEDAVAIVEGVLPLSPQYESFFGVGVVDAPAESPAADFLADSTTPDDVDTPKGEEPDGATPFSELQEALQQLRQEAGGLGKELIDAGTALQNEGRLPRSELITDLHRLRDRLKALADQVTQISTTSVFPLRQETTPRSISSVLSDLKEAADIARKEEISELLAVAARIRHRDNELDHILAPCRETTRKILIRLDQTSGLASATRPLAVLVRLITQLSSLSNDELDALRNHVAEAFGDPLARAASRGQLEVVPEDCQELATRDSAEQGSKKDVSPGTQDQTTSPTPPEHPGDSSPSPSNPVDVIKKPDPTELAVEANPNKAVSPTTPGPELVELHPRLADDPTHIAMYTTAWSLLESGDASLAYQIARTLEVVHRDNVRLLPSSVVRTCLISPWIRTGLSDHVDSLRESLDDIYVVVANLESLPREVRQPLEILVLSALLRPTLVASSTGALSALPLINPPVRGMLRLRDQIVQYVRSGLDITPNVLKGVREHAAWSQAALGHRQEVARWLAGSRQARIIYAPTTAIWRSWLSPGASLGSALESVSAGTESRQDIEVTLRDWSTPSFVDEQIVGTDGRLRGRIAKRRPIEARALVSIKKHVQEAIELLKEWRELQSNQPHGAASQQDDGTQLQRTLVGALSSTTSDLQEYGERNTDSVYARAATTMASAMLADLSDLFDPQVVEKDLFTSPASLCGRALLRLPHLLVGEDWEPMSGRTKEMLVSLTDAGSVAPMSWNEAFRSHLDLRHHLSAERTLDILAEDSKDSVATESLRSELARQRQHWTAALGDQIIKVGNDVTRSAWYNLLPETTFLELKEKVESLNPERVLVFPEADKVLASVTLRLDEFKKQRRDDICTRLARELPDATPELKSRIEHSLAQGHLVAANEYIDLANDGQVPTPSGSTNVFDEYFPYFVRDVITHFQDERKGTTTVLDAIKRIGLSRNMGPVKMAEVPKAQANSAAQLLNSWFSAKNRRGNLQDHLRTFFEGLGCLEVMITGGQTVTADRQYRGELTISPIEDRDICVVTTYGSAAAGRYRFLCLWDLPSEEDLISAARSPSSGPLIVLYFGRMTEQRRRGLAILARSKQRSVLVIDETMVWFLCAERGSRLRRLFECLLPFSFANPYITTASLLPPEMFFGRLRESNSIFDPYGTNLVFGGRQLGKTALLRHTARRFHRPAAGVLVRWVDLVAAHIGITRPIDDIWNLIGLTLQEDRVLVRSTKTPLTIRRKVKAWLEENTERRIVLLLDEADEFLKSDSERQFQHLTQLKGLMDETDRRFKVVFAGLHNVQRTSRDPNTPIAHLGEPVCVGPLLGATDAAEAVALINSPLNAIGFRFESQDLLMQILSHTNYYPSLIQLYCKHLVDHLNSQVATLFDVKNAPPYMITSQHLEEVQNSELRERILDKFKLTLDLDARYRVIALCIALEVAERASNGSRPEAVDPEWVRAQALFWWPAGFQDDVSLEAFGTILDEMVGLGVLRKTTGHSYTLRSSNLANLLGTQNEIELRLLDAADQEPPQPYEALHFRRGCSDDKWERSPLTAQQESMLLAETNEVVVLCGSQMTGLDAVDRFLPLACWDYAHYATCDAQSADQVVAETTQLLQDNSQVISVLAVPPSCPWTPAWVLQLNKLLKRKTSHRRFVHVVFVAGPRQTWDWVSTEETQTSGRTRGIREMSLHRWSLPSLRRWLDDIGVAVGDESAHVQIVGATGGWQMPLDEFARRCKTSPHQWSQHLTQLKQEFIDDSEWSRRLGMRTESLPTFRALATLDEAVTVEEMGFVDDALNVELAHRALRWGSLLSYTATTDQKRWTIDPLVGRFVLMS